MSDIPVKFFLVSLNSAGEPIARTKELGVRNMSMLPRRGDKLRLEDKGKEYVVFSACWLAEEIYTHISIELFDPSETLC